MNQASYQNLDGSTLVLDVVAVEDNKVDLAVPGTKDVVVSGCPVSETGGPGLAVLLTKDAAKKAKKVKKGSAPEGQTTPAGADTETAEEEGADPDQEEEQNETPPLPLN